MIMLIIILLIPTGDGHGGKASAVIQQSFNSHEYGKSNSIGECETIKSQLEAAYGNQVISSKCISSY